MGYSLDENNPQNTPGYSLTPESTVPTDQATSQRAVKADYGLGKESPGVATLSTAILGGRESDVRNNVANEEALKWDQAKTSLVTKIAASQGGKMTPEDRDFMLALTRQQYQSGDASDILEKRFAEKYTNDVVGVHGLNFEGVYQRAGQLAAPAASDALDIMTGVVKSNQYEQTQLENLHSEWQKTSWLSAAPQYVGQVIPLLSAYRLHNAITTAPTTTLLPGTNLGEQIAYLKALPYDKRKAAYDAALTDLKGRNMLDAMTFAEAVVSFNATDSFLANAMGVADAGTLGSGLMKNMLRLIPTSASEKALQKGISAADAILRMSPNIASPKASEALKAGRMTAEDVLRESSAPAINKALIEEMQKEVGVTRAASPQVFVKEGDFGNIADAQVLPGKTTAFYTASEKEGSKGIKFKVEPDDGLHYIAPEDAEKLKINKGDRLVQFQDGSVAVSRKSRNELDIHNKEQWSVPLNDDLRVKLGTEPQIGHIPVHLGEAETKFGTKIYNEPQVHTPIKSLVQDTGTPLFKDEAGNVIPHSASAEEGMVPISHDQFGNLHADEPIRGKAYYVSKAIADKLPTGPAKEYIPSAEVARGVPVEDETRRISRAGGVTIDKDGPSFSADGFSFVRGGEHPGPGLVKVTVSKDGAYIHVDRTEPWKQAMEDMRVALKDAAKAVSDTTLDPPAVLTGMGDIPKAAEVIATKKLSGIAKGETEALSTGLPSAMDPANFFGKGAAMSRAFADAIVTRMTGSTKKLEAILGKLDVPRGTPEAVAKGVQETSAKLQAEYGGRLNDGILNFKHVPPELNPNGANLDSVVMQIGLPNKTPFSSRAQAEHYFTDIYKFKPGEAEIMQEGASFHIGVTSVVDETTEGWRAAMVTPGNSTPVNMWNMMLNRFRSSEDLLSKMQRDNRHLATHAPQIMNKAIKEEIELTRNAISSKERKEVGQMLEINRDMDNPNLRNPDGSAKRGMWYNNANEFEQEFMNRFLKMPSAGQVAHYFNYTRLSDFDHTIRNLAMYRDKARLGLEQYAFGGIKGKTPYFEGKAIDNIPWGGQDAAIWFQEAGKPGQLLYKHDMVNSPTGMTKAQLEKKIEEGYKVIQVGFPTDRPLAPMLKAMGQPMDEQIHFVVTNSKDRLPLSYDQLEYRPGGHSIYPDPWFVKQGVFQKGVGGRIHYYGDNAVMNFATEAQAKKYAKAFDTAREMLKNNDPALPRHLATNLPYDLDQFKKMFTSGHLDLDTPIGHTYTGASTLETMPGLAAKYPGHVDATKSEWNIGAMMDKSYQADRDGILNTVNEKVFKISNSRQLDPYVALNQALGQGVRNLWMADQKISAVQSWIAEFGEKSPFGNVFKPNDKTLNNNPMFFLYNPQFNEGTVDKARLAAAKASRLAIINFNGVQSEVAGSITHLQNKLANLVYSKFGQGGAEVFADHMLPAIRDPAQYARAVAFHAKLGFFNPIQAVVQAQSLAHVLAVAGPTHALPSFAAAYFARRLAQNDTPAIVDAFAKKAASFGYKENHFREMVKGLRENGLFEVAGETAMRDDVFDPKLYRSTVGHWLDKGTMFFAEGERAVRLAAFATAHREWRVANPLATLDNRAMGTIMTRSDNLSVNMTRASAATWQQGVLSIPLQFMAFNARLAEQLLPGTSRLSTAEKLRAYATYSTLYGIPTAAAATTGVWPYYDDIKEAAMKRGIDMSPKYIEALMTGIPSTLLHMATGHQYNIPERLGPNGSTIFKDAISGEKSVMATIGGASGSIIGDIWSSTDPLRRAVAGVFTGESEQFPLKHTDLFQGLGTISTASLATRLLGWASYGKYISKNGVQVGEMDGMDAAMSVLGLTPTHITDAYTKQKAGRSDKKAQKHFEDEALQNYAMAVQAGAEGDQQGFKDYMTRVGRYVKLGDLNVEEQQKLFHRALQFRPDLEDKVNWDFVRNSPDSQYTARFEQYFINKAKKAQ